jgi:hypothetical protein
LLAAWCWNEIASLGRHLLKLRWTAGDKGNHELAGADSVGSDFAAFSAPSARLNN